MKESMKTKYPYVFVVGCPRSGTTLLQRMLNAHPQLAVANDTHFIIRIAQCEGLNAKMELTPNHVKSVYQYKRFHRFGLTKEQVIQAAQNVKTYPEFISKLYKTYAQLQGKLYAGEKTPDYVKHITFLHKLVPKARFIHIIRDGREVALSTLQWSNRTKGPAKLDLWQKSPIAVCALWWSWQVESGLQQGRALGDNLYKEIHYQQLVSQPQQTMQQLARFLDLPYSPDMVDFHLGKTKSEQGLSAKSAWLPPTKGLRDYKTQMNSADLMLFESLTAPLLESLGYELSANSTNRTTDCAAGYQNWWDNHVARKERKYGALSKRC